MYCKENTKRRYFPERLNITFIELEIYTTKTFIIGALEYKEQHAKHYIKGNDYQATM